jgi:hypothetical protein
VPVVEGRMLRNALRRGEVEEGRKIGLLV